MAPEYSEPERVPELPTYVGSETPKWEKSEFFRLFPTFPFPNNFESRLLFTVLDCCSA